MIKLVATDIDGTILGADNVFRPKILETIEKSINRSNELLTQVLKDDKLNTYVFNFHSADKDESAVYKNLDKASRDSLRNFASGMLDRLNKATAQIEEAHKVESN